MGYYDTLIRRVSLGGESIQAYSKAGAAPWDELAISAALLAETVEIAPGDAILVMQGGGALAVWAERLGAAVHYYDHNLIDLRLARLMAEANQCQQLAVYDAAFPRQRGVFDAALLAIPKGRGFARLLLTAARRALKPEGRLYLAGRNAVGAKAVLADAAAIFGHAVTLKSKARHRVGVAIKTAAHQPDLALPDPQPLNANGLQLLTLPGVFSADALDAGTAMLIQSMDKALCEGRQVLDVGCGYGIIGLAAAQHGARSVDMTDVNLLAVECAALSVQANGLRQCAVIASDLYEGLQGKAYDLILSNPPFHSGHQIETETAEALIYGAWEWLEGGGRLRLVANRFLPYDRIIRAAFGEARIIAEDNRYWALEGRKK